jgi:hypothetical protein
VLPLICIEFNNKGFFVLFQGLGRSLAAFVFLELVIRSPSENVTVYVADNKAEDFGRAHPTAMPKRDH